MKWPMVPGHSKGQDRLQPTVQAAKTANAAATAAAQAVALLAGVLERQQH